MPSSKAASRTDWDRVKREIQDDSPIPHDPEDGPYNPNDDREVEAWWKQADVLDARGRLVRRGRGPQKTPTKTPVTIRLSPDVVDHFRATGKGWQSRMDAALREWLQERHPSGRRTG